MASPPTATAIQGGWLGGGLHDFLTSEYEAHGFTSDAFVAHELGIADPFPVDHIHVPVQWWRGVAFARILVHIIFFILFLPYLLFPWSLIVVVLCACGLLMILARLLQQTAGVGDGTLRWIWRKSLVLLVRRPILPCAPVRILLTQSSLRRCVY
jgi:hypothetical protein